MVSAPPRPRGTTWSISSRTVEPQTPPSWVGPWKRFPSRAFTSRFTFAGTEALRLSCWARSRSSAASMTCSSLAPGLDVGLAGLRPRQLLEQRRRDREVQAAKGRSERVDGGPSLLRRDVRGQFAWASLSSRCTGRRSQRLRRHLVHQHCERDEARAVSFMETPSHANSGPHGTRSFRAGSDSVSGDRRTSPEETIAAGQLSRDVWSAFSRRLLRSRRSERSTAAPRPPRRPRR
jgi:hypothetical protein